MEISFNLFQKTSKYSIGFSSFNILVTLETCLSHHVLQIKQPGLNVATRQKNMYHVINITIDAPPSSLMDSIVSPKVKTMEGEGVGARSLAHNTSGVEGRARTPGWD